MGLFLTERRSVTPGDLWASDGDWMTTRGYSVADAIKLSAVVACVNLRANLIGQLPYAAYRLVDGSPVQVPVQPKQIESPSRLPRSFWLRQMSISRDLWGNAVGVIAGRDAAGYPKGWEWVDPSRVTFDESGPDPVVRINGQVVPMVDLVVVPGFPVPGSMFGISPLQRSGLVELSHRAQEFGRDWFRNGTVPSVVLKSSVEDLTADQADGVRDRVTSNWRRRRPAVLGAGWDLEVLKMNADESQFLATMRHAQVDICQVFGVPPEEIGVATSGQAVTYANREQKAQQVLVNTMNVEFVLVQEVFTAQVPRPQFVRFNTGALLRTDLKTRYESYAIGISSGFLDVDEVRALEDRPPMPERDDEPPAGGD